MGLEGAWSGRHSAQILQVCEFLAGVLTETTAELAAALTLAAARRVVEADRFMRAGHYKGWLPDLFVGSLLQARPLLHPVVKVRVSVLIT